MATGPGVNQGKTSFLEEFLASNRDANLDAVNQAWIAAGNDGTISESLLSKIRARLGLTGRRIAAASADESSGKPRARSTARSKRPGRSEKVPPRAEEAGSTPVNGLDASPRGGSASHRDEDVLDEVEEGIDELIQRIRDLGGRPDVVKALRRARRLLVRSHQG